MRRDSTHNTQHTTHNTQHTTHNTQHSTLNTEMRKTPTCFAAVREYFTLLELLIVIAIIGIR